MFVGVAKKLAPSGLAAGLPRRTISYDTTQPYDKRWHWKFRYAYYSEPRDTDSTRVPKPEDSPMVDRYFGSLIRDFKRRLNPGARLLFERAYRLKTPFDFYMLPAFTLLGLQFFPLDYGFKILTALPAIVLYTRIRDKVRDPEMEETYFREIFHSNEVLKKYFSIETMQVLDYQFEYTKGFPSEEEFPEFKNKLFSNFIRVLQRRQQHGKRILCVRRSRIWRHRKSDCELKSSKQCR